MAGEKKKIVLSKLKTFADNNFTLSQIIPVFIALVKQAFENIVGKGENAGIRHFLHFLQCCLPSPKQILMFWIHLFCRLQML